MSSTPLVSIGIPTYNRPDGLLRTIQQMVAQTYSNLEIIVSNNCSPNPTVAQLSDRCAALDTRIKVVHQPENLGILKNFQYVLNHTSADYFMWAADDDEWHPDFIKTCVEAMLAHEVGTVMPGFMRHNRPLGLKGAANLPRMTGINRYADIQAFFQHTPHSIFYGLHRRSTIAWFGNDDDLFDDEYFLVRQILEHGILTLPDKVLYTAGIEDAKYQIKLPKEAEDRYFFQCRRLMRFASLFIESPRLGDLQNIELMRTVILNKLRFVLSFEAEMRNPSQLALAKMIYVLLGQLDVTRLPVYAGLLSQANAAAQAHTAPHEAVAH